MTERIASTPTAIASKIEGPTIALAILIYGGWVALTHWHDVLPVWMLPFVGGWLIAWHNSLQHETIHGHPTGQRWINNAIGAIPLSLWLPYAVYLRTHRAHHASAEITDPFDDPESRYLHSGKGFANALLLATEALQSTLLGRLILGPPITVGRFLVCELARAWTHPTAWLADWLPHLSGCAFILMWLHHCGIGLGTYTLFYLYPGIALSLLRSFAEHRAAASPDHRIAVVETRGLLGLLFLNNNLHSAHHDRPGMPWYRLPDFYRENRARLLKANGGLLYSGYGAVVRSYLFRPHDHLVHPAYMEGGSWLGQVEEGRR